MLSANSAKCGINLTFYFIYLFIFCYSVGRNEDAIKNNDIVIVDVENWKMSIS